MGTEEGGSNIDWSLKLGPSIGVKYNTRIDSYVHPHSIPSILNVEASTSDAERGSRGRVLAAEEAQLRQVEEVNVLLSQRAPAWMLSWLSKSVLSKGTRRTDHTRIQQGSAENT